MILSGYVVNEILTEIKTRGKSYDDNNYSFSDLHHRCDSNVVCSKELGEPHSRENLCRGILAVYADTRCHSLVAHENCRVV